MNQPKCITVTGGAGQIAYNLLFRIGSGELLGSKQPIILKILEIPEALKALEGVKMELEDCAFPLLHSIVITADPYEAFEGTDFALLIGAKPRGPGMERKDLLMENAKIFVEQGKALNEKAHHNAKIFVVGNPCNTNCLITMSHCPNIPKSNFYAMTRLDQNRATFFLSQKAKVPVTDITHMIIWGNHSSTQVPDFFHARICGKEALSIVKDSLWFENEFISLVQKRGAAIISVRGKSSAASAAQGIIDSVHDVLTQTKPGKYFSAGVSSEGNPYGIDEDLIFSFPCYTLEEGECSIVPGLSLNDSLIQKLKVTEQELIEERNLVQHTMGDRRGS